MFVYTRIRDFLQHEFLFGFIQCIFADGRDESPPTPTECTLWIIHAYQRTPTVGADLSCPHITEYTVWITVYNQCFTHVRPL
ncbi:hypothetical protein [Prevotella pallens]|uniref:hypothetical protein n=1 Tax=Prevotella pallens TaxID=60133 RepID=UPI0023F1F772|nr:hypothetical protein [Prevotella pallens]